MAFKDHFSSNSDDYSKYRPHYPNSLYEFIINNVAEYGHAWDCATGNGQAAVRLAEYFNKVSGTDASKSQIDHAVQHPKVSYSVATAESSGLNDSSVDLITVAQALHWFDFDQFYGEVKRVAKPSAIIAVWTYGMLSFGHTEIDNLIHKFYFGKVGEYWPPERRYIDEKYRTIPFPYNDILTPDLEIKIKHTAQSLLAYFGTWSAVKNYKKQKGEDPLLEFGEAIVKAWPTGEIESKTPLYLRLAKVFEA